jgi:protein-L-isoaspartate(D-aspartate) O-methyltransferase
MFDDGRRELVERLKRWGYLTKPEIIKAFERVPRHEFVPENLRDYSYADQPLSIGYGQTISAPSMIAIMMESMGFSAGQRVLEIGSGSGYNAALIAEIVGREGEVITIERIGKLADFAEANLRKTGYSWVRVLTGDGTCGYQEGAPWDRILVTACAPELPKPLIEQLKIGGKIGAPVGRSYTFQTWVVGEKVGGSEIRIHEHGGCSFVPLLGRYGWKKLD